MAAVDVEYLRGGVSGELGRWLKKRKALLANAQKVRERNAAHGFTRLPPIISFLADTPNYQSFGQPFHVQVNDHNSDVMVYKRCWAPAEAV